MRYVTHLEGAIDGTRLDPAGIHSLHADRPIWVRYDLEAIREVVSPATLNQRPETMWRYRELLPYFRKSDIVSLGERWSPLLECPRLARAMQMDQLWIKDESMLPTGSFKSRGLAMAITMAKSLGIRRVALPTAGNAGGAAAAYAARAGIECFVFMPEDTPVINQYECALYGARTFLVNGLINDCGRIVREGKDRLGWFDLSTLKEPYRIEGKKTMGLELAEQFEWDLPDVILYPTGGGTGLIGMWKAFAELEQLGWLKSHRKPRMISVQSTGCAPIATAFASGERFAAPFPNAQTRASGLRVPVAVGDFMILDAVRESGGLAVAADESQIPHWMEHAMRTEGLPICPETAACLGALQSLRGTGQIGPEERVVIFNTGAAQKYVEVMQTELSRVDRHQPIHWEALVSPP